MIYIPGFIFICLLETVFASIIPCTNDRSCAINQYCGASRCMDCISCSYINRNNLLDCPKSLLDCGSCLTGYGEIQLNNVPTDHIKQCEKQVANNKITCFNDAHCSEGQFCKNQNCKVCLDCHIYNMHSSTVCAKRTADCGACLPGYLHLDGKDEFQTRSCAGPTASLLSQNTEVQVNVNAASTIGVVLVLGLLVLVVIFMHRARKHRSERVNISEAPPPYISSTINNPTSDLLVEQSVMCTSYKESGEEDNTARVFRLPNYAHAPSVNSTSHISNPTSDEVVEQCIVCPGYKESGEVENTARVFRPPNYAYATSVTGNDDNTQAQDEETLPCTWRPDNEEDSVHSRSGSLTFAGCLISETSATDAPTVTDQPAPKRPKLN